MGTARKPSGTKTNKPGDAVDILQSAENWEAVQAGDDLLMGAEEGGFMGLEVLKPGSGRTPFITGEPSVVTAPSEAKSEEAAGGKGSKKRKLRDDQLTMEKLQAQMAKLQRENAHLNASLQQLGGDVRPPSTPKAKRQKIVKAAPAAIKPQQAATTANVDISGWKHFELAPEIEAAIAQLGFHTPTPIQEETLMPAMRDRRDVIGAAQTASDARSCASQPSCSQPIQSHCFKATVRRRLLPASL